MDVPISVVAAMDDPVDTELLSTTDVSFPCMIAVRVPLANGTSITMTDYASVGKTWDETSRCAVWMPTPEE